jgi:aspartyl-tRNA(Asn)/glutamyl-tRNA(Gln) amidotransferase subunit A
MADARRAESAIVAGGYRGPLHGIPVGLKDIIATSGIRTRCGSRIFAERVPEAALVARRLSAAGTVLLGKLNADEFAMGTTNDNPHYGPARNPWDLTRVSGGSSGGSGVATATRLVAAAIGTDTGGSIRIPAALCGCVGLKPSFGLVSRTGVYPLSVSRDHVGPLTRTVEEAALVLQAIVGYDPHDPESVDLASVDYRATLRQGVAGLRIGVPGGRHASLPTTEVAQAIGSAAEILAGLGVKVMPVELDDALDLSTITTMSAVESRYHHREFLPHRLADYGPDLQAILSEPEPDRAAISAAIAKGEAIRTAYQRVLAAVDLLITPAVPCPAPPIGVPDFVMDGRAYTRLDLAAFTLPVNYARVPALTVPGGFSATGLPIGLMIIGRRFDYATVLRAGHAYLQATDWHRRPPPSVGPTHTPRTSADSAGAN